MIQFKKIVYTVQTVKLGNYLIACKLLGFLTDRGRRLFGGF